jgi:hypothetical protein
MSHIQFKTGKTDTKAASSAVKTKIKNLAANILYLITKLQSYGLGFMDIGVF